MKTIRKNTVVVEHVAGGVVRWEYAVEKNASLVLVFTVRASGDAELVPSVHLKGAGSTATVIGLISGSRSARIRVETLQHHAAPETTSTLLVKSVLRDESECLYTGSIRVDKAAQKTDAYQRNENLLIGARAHAVSSPALEILANDVRCTHGAIVKTIDQQELWYLSTRGIPHAAGRSMIADGFLTSAYALIPEENDRQQVLKQVYQ